MGALRRIVWADEGYRSREVIWAVEGRKSGMSNIDTILKLVFVGCAMYLTFSPKSTKITQFRVPIPEELEIPVRIVVGLVALKVLWGVLSK